MNRVLSLMLTLLLIATHAYAADNPLQKLGRGFVNIATGPVEIVKEVRAHWIKGTEKTFHVIVWIFCGTVKGTAMSVARMASGAWDVVTFPINIPSKYEPLKNPEFVFQEWPHRKEGVVYKNIGDK